MTSVPLSPSIARSLLRSGMDTVQIAGYVGRSEAEVYNALGDKLLPPREFANAAFNNLIQRSADLQQQRKGKRRRTADAQNAATGKRTAAVSLPRLTILENSGH